MKKSRSRTPRICERKILTLELNASAEALVARRRKYFRMVGAWVPECFDYRAEVVVTEPITFSYHLFIRPMAFVGENFSIENLCAAPSQGVCSLQYWKYFGTGCWRDDAVCQSICSVPSSGCALLAASNLAHGFAVEYGTGGSDLSRLLSSAMTCAGCRHVSRQRPRCIPAATWKRSLQHGRCRIPRRYQHHPMATGPQVTP